MTGVVLLGGTVRGAEALYLGDTVIMVGAEISGSSFLGETLAGLVWARDSDPADATFLPDDLLYFTCRDALVPPDLSYFEPVALPFLVEQTLIHTTLSQIFQEALNAAGCTRWVRPAVAE